MQTLKKLLIALATLSFLFAAIGIFTPGWMVIYMDVPKMTELQLKKAPLQVQQQYKQQQILMRKQNPQVPVVKNINVYAGPFYIKYCVAMTAIGVDTSICPVLSSGDIISMFRQLGNVTQGPIAQMMEHLKESGSTVTLDSMVNTLVGIVVISSLILIQIAVSLILTIVYTCIKYPRKRIGIAGGVSSIFSGIVTFLFVVIFLIIYGEMTGSVKKSIGEAGILGFPYSTMLTCLGSVLFCLAGGILIRVTLKSKEQFNYEMMVIDTSKGGGTYIAKT